MNRFSKTFSAGPNKSSKSAAFNSCSDTSASDTVEIHKRLASEILLSTILSKGKQLKRFVLFFQLEQLQQTAGISRSSCWSFNSNRKFNLTDNLRQASLITRSLLFDIFDLCSETRQRLMTGQQQFINHQSEFCVQILNACI